MSVNYIFQIIDTVAERITLTVFLDNIKIRLRRLDMYGNTA